MAARPACRRSTGLISIDASGPTAFEVPAAARLGDAPHLQEVVEPSRPLDLVPRHILQQDAPRGWPARLRVMAAAAGGASLILAGFAAGFYYLLSFRDAELPREVEIPVEVVREPPKPASAPRAAGTPGGAQGAAGPRGDPARPDAASGPPPMPPQPKPPAPTPEAKLAAALAPPIAPPAPPAAPTAGKPGPPPPAPAGETAPPKLVAPEPDAAKAATQDKDNKAANLIPDEHQVEQATREARPVAVPRVLTTQDPKAETSVPAPAPPPPAPVDRPTPPTSAKVPSATDRLAAALPMDVSAMPQSFRSVFAGNASAQIKAAYNGVVQGRIQRATAELSAAASARRLSGAVAVSFTIDDAGRLADLKVLQSSGDRQLDDMVLHAIEQIAPFPVPPTEAEHTFQKAFLVGG